MNKQLILVFLTLFGAGVAHADFECSGRDLLSKETNTVIITKESSNGSFHHEFETKNSIFEVVASPTSMGMLSITDKASGIVAEAHQNKDKNYLLILKQAGNQYIADFYCKTL